MHRHPLVLVLVMLAVLLSSCATRTKPPLNTPGNVDLERYMGTWYSIASIPKFFEKGCRCNKADYAMNEDGTVAVTNSCIRDGEYDEAKGTARLRAPGDPSRLEVSFFGPFWGEYTIIHIDTDYRHALVGTRDRDSLWLLSRKRQMSGETLQKLENEARRQGFDVSRLRQIEQNCGSNT